MVVRRGGGVGAMGTMGDGDDTDDIVMMVKSVWEYRTW